MKTKTLAFVLLASGASSACVHVVEREVIVERPVYIEVAANNGQCSAGNVTQSSSSSQSEAPLMMRGSAGASAAIPSGLLVASQMAMGIGPGMSLDEREVLQRKVQNVLETSSDGAGVRWVSYESGQVVDFVASDTLQEERIVTVERGEEVGRLPESLVVEPAVYVTREEVTLRPTPSPTSIVSGGNVPAGQKVKVLGRVTGINNDSWFLVGGPDGAAYGYMEPAQLTPNGVNQIDPQEIYARPTGTRLRDTVSASVMCRTLVYGSGEFDNVMRTCREPGGRWIAEPPVAKAGSACRAEPQPSFLLGDKEI